MDVQSGVALAWSLASSEGAVGVRRSEESDSLGVSETAVENRFVDVAETEQETVAGTEEEHQAVGGYIHESKPVGAEQEDQEALVQVGTPEGAVVRWPGGTAVEASAAGVETRESGPCFEWELPVVESCGGTVRSVVLCIQLGLQVGRGDEAWGRS